MSLTEHYDVIIVGAGPAGSCTALYIDPNHSGLRVLLIDAKKQVGIPMQCGEAIPTFQELQNIFPEADCPELYELPKEVYAGNIDGIKFKSPSGKYYVANLKGQMFHRDKLDQHLFSRAVETGIEYRLGCRVKSIEKTRVSTSDGCVYGADLIVGADGVYSTVADSFDFFEANRDVCPCSLALVKGNFNSSFIELWFESRFPGGYFWLFPKNGHNEANIGVGVRGISNVRQILDQVIAEIEQKYEISAYARGGGAVPLGGLKNRIVHDSIALVGDAAGMVFPTNGGGTGLAMMAGKWLGRTIAERRPLIEYGQKIEAVLGPILRSSLRKRRQMDLFRKNDALFSALMWMANMRGWRHFIIG